jgi:hypothetical protein
MLTAVMRSIQSYFGRARLEHRSYPEVMGRGQGRQFSLLAQRQLHERVA